VSNANIILITGGARSGKSQFAERLALSSAIPVTYLATMQKVSATADSELYERISKHQKRRPKHWELLEEPLLVAQKVSHLNERGSQDGQSRLVLLDCLSLFVSNLLLSIPASINDQAIKNELLENVLVEARQLLEVMSRADSLNFIVVTNEVGSGIVPDNFLARAFRDTLGSTNQMFAERAGEVYACFSGLPLKLKG
jgi:adenosylcobinamide kinase/adenosylcobinamide-phosphate guanylyltransferase